MSRKKRVLFIAVFMVVFAVTSMLAPDASTYASSPNKVKSIVIKIGNKTVSKKIYSLKKGKKVTVKVSVTPKKAKKSVVFKSSNTKVATISKKGVVTAKKVGTAKISVVVKGKNGKNKSTWMKIKVKGKSSVAITPNKKPTPEPSPDPTPEPSPDPTPEPSPDPTPEPDPTPSPDPTPEPSPDPTPNPEAITIKDHIIVYDANEIYGRIYMPQKEGVYPAIIMCHGYNGVGTDFVEECTYFAQNGYVAYAFDFRGGSVNSKSSGKSTDMTIFTEKEDLIAVFEHIRELSNVDSNNVFLHGGSQGGLVAALAAEELADEVRGLMLYFPAFNIPYDWTAMHPDVEQIPEVIPWWGLDLGKEFAVSIHNYKTFEHIGSYSKNVLILYGAKDAIVQRSYMDKAKEIYTNCELIVYPNEGHGFTPDGVEEAKEELLQFMQKQ